MHGNKNRDHHKDFGWIYKVLCHKNSTKPLPAIRAQLHKNSLRFCVDNVSLDDWGPILNSIAQNQNLTEIYVYGRSRLKKIRESINTERKLQQIRRGRQPVLYTNYLLRCLVDSISYCLKNSSAISALCLDGIPLALKYVSILATGLLNNRNLRSLSLARCEIGDLGCDIILRSLENNPNIMELNLSSCYLTNRSAMFMGIFFNRKIDIIPTNMKDSLENKTTMKKMSLHTLILNRNQKFSNDGVRHLALILKDNHQLRKLSLQECGITASGGQVLIKLLQSNKTLTIIDIKDNSIPPNILEVIFTLLKKKHIEERKLLTRRKLIIERKVKLDKLSSNRNKANPKIEILNKKRKLLYERLRRIYQIYNKRNIKSYSIKLKSSRNKENYKKKQNDKNNTPKKKFAKINISKLKLYLTGMQENNESLTKNLQNTNKMIMDEVKYRLDIEQGCEQMKPQMEDLKRRILLHNCKLFKTHEQSQLFECLQTAFDKLESIPTCLNSGMKFNLEAIENIDKIAEEKFDKCSPVLKSTPTEENLCTYIPASMKTTEITNKC